MPRRTDRMPRRRKAAPGSWQPGSWQVPWEVELDAKRRELLWRYAPPSKRVQRDSSGLLQRFLDLGRPGVRPERFLPVARHYGVLHVRGRPFEGRGRDPLSAWREHARLLGALRALGEAVREDAPPPDEARGQLRRWTGLETHPTPVGDATLLLRAVEGVLAEVRLRPRLEGWPGPAPRVTYALGGGSLRGALAAEVMLALGGGESLFTACAACGALHQPRGQRGRRSFCRVCGDRKAGVQAAKRDYRRRQREARRLRADGHTLREIRERVGARDLATLRGWLEERPRGGSGRSGTRPAHGSARRGRRRGERSRLSGRKRRG